MIPRAPLAALALCAALAVPSAALAHKVIAGLFPGGDVIEGEIGLSNGAMAVDTPVEVFGPGGEKLGETRTDADGFFRWTPTAPVAHSFRVDMGAGHVAVVEMPAEEVAALMPAADAAAPAAPTSAAAPAPSAASSTPVAQAAPQVVAASLTEEEKRAIATLLRDEIRPLRREIAAYKEKNDLQTILGGLGYIAGLFGLGFYLAARRRMEGSGS
ncbi:cobalt ABC transporter permease [Rhodovulum sp. DZ06]|uniref:cobalt ABC transporter permease n=1 Tax=Rhodovulum sp. DZ06 TaxID=3425126 RepID=UPI003D34CC3E